MPETDLPMKLWKVYRLEKKAKANPNSTKLRAEAANERRKLTELKISPTINAQFPIQSRESREIVPFERTHVPQPEP